MKVQIDHARLDMAKVRQEMRWETWKALAGILGAAVAIAGAMVGVAAWAVQHFNSIPPTH